MKSQIQLVEIREERQMEKQYHPQKAEPGPNWAYRRRGLANILRMGHCAPAVMQTILEDSSTEKDWLVRFSAGMPGGIGNTGFECGGVTSPLALSGIRYGLSEFVKAFGSTQCRAITRCDFSYSVGVSNYIEGERITRCRTIASKVAEKVQMMLA
jgi:hypothetical protein